MAMRSLWSLLFCTAVVSSESTGATGGDEHIVIKPIKNDPKLPTKLMVFIPGGRVPNTHYIKTSQAIQNATKINLWVVIPSVTQRLCIIECTEVSKILCEPLHNSVNKAVQKAQGMGFKSDSNPFLVGHSLGGTCANYLLQTFQSKDNYAAAVLMGGYVDETGPGSLTEYKVPIMTLGAQLDGGIAKPTRISLWWDQFQQYQQHHGANVTLQTKPVIILPKIDHSNFCPGFPVPGDLPSETDPAVASTMIGETVAAFLHLQPISKQDAATVALARTTLESRVKYTANLLAPFLKAAELEVTGDDGTYNHTKGTTSPWCAHAQVLLAGPIKSTSKSLKVTDAYFPKASDPPPAMEHCHNNYSTSTNGSVTVYTVLTCSHARYETDVDNTGGNAGAHQIGCKMFSQEKVLQILGINRDQITSTEPKDACKQINQHAIDTAMSLISTSGLPDTLTRYHSKGRGICLLPDFHAPGNIGPLWASGKLKLSVNDTCLTVASLAEYSSLKSPIFPGGHYCKLLSPARVVEWVMTDNFAKRL